MAVRKKKAKRKSAQSQFSIEELIARLSPYRNEIAGGILLLIAIITLLSLLSLTGGTFSRWWGDLFSQLFGWGASVAAILLGVFGALLLFGRLRDEEKPLPFDMIVGIEILFLVESITTWFQKFIY